MIAAAAGAHRFIPRKENKKGGTAATTTKETLTRTFVDTLKNDGVLVEQIYM